MYSNEKEDRAIQYLTNAYGYNSEEFEEFDNLIVKHALCYNNPQKRMFLNDTLQCVEKRLQSMLIAEVVSTATLTPRAIACAERLQQVRVAVAETMGKDDIPALALLLVALSFDLDWTVSEDTPQPTPSSKPEIVFDDLPF